MCSEESSTSQGLRYKKIRKRVAIGRERLYDKVVSKWHDGCMSTSRSRTSRVFTISFPENMFGCPRSQHRDLGQQLFAGYIDCAVRWQLRLRRIETKPKSPSIPVPSSTIELGSGMTGTLLLPFRYSVSMAKFSSEGIQN